MLDTTGHVPGALSPRAPKAPWNEATPAADTDRSGERARADRALAVFDLRLASLAEMRTRYAAETTDNAALLRDAAREAAQALLAAYAGLRDRVELG